jgi:hypothetical protein
MLAFLVLLLSGGPNMQTAEQLARAAWFPFELKHDGDWSKFYAEKKAKEDALVKAFVKRPQEMRELVPQTPEEARALRVLQEEFREVAMEQKDAIVAEAKRVLVALQKGDLDAAAEGCVMYNYDTKDRKGMTVALLREKAAVLKRIALQLDANNFGADLHFTRPEPATGMVGQVEIPFGKKVPRPKGKDKEAYPEQPVIELWWSGLVMPHANGPRFATPQPGAPQEGQWHFYQVIEPYSRRPMFLL